MTLAFERHYNPQEIGTTWGWSSKSVLRMFKDEPGVLKVERRGTRTNRGYSSIAVPEAVLIRVHQRLTVKK